MKHLSKVVFLAVLLFSSVAHATDYYVRNGGNDANAGTSPQTAWRTLHKVNSTHFQAGDRILFQRGDTWPGAGDDDNLRPCASTSCSGTSVAPIQIDAYGSGALPRIIGTNQATAAVHLLNQDYWEIRHLDISDDGVGGDMVVRNGILAQCNRLSGSRQCRHIHIQDNHVRFINGIIGYPLNAGINVTFQIHNSYWSAIETRWIDHSNYWDDVVISGNVIDHVDGIGINVTELNPGDDDPLCVQQGIRQGPAPNVYGVHDCARVKQKSTNVLIESNQLEDIQADGIITKQTEEAVIQYNVLDRWGLEDRCDHGACCVAGIWTAISVGTVIQDNEVYDGAPGCDRTAFDMDIGAVSTRIQYNYTRHNAGGFLLFYDDHGAETSVNTLIEDPIVRFNVSDNDGVPGTSVISKCGYANRFGSGPYVLDLANNTFYQSATNYYSGTTNDVSFFGRCGVAVQCGTVAESGPQCENSDDDDADGWINDGCPIAGRAPTSSVVASSQELSTYGPSRATDANMGTRWSSKFSDPQWLQIDLGTARAIHKVVLRWEAHASHYKIQYWNGTSWVDLAEAGPGYPHAADGGADFLHIGATARWWRMYGISRATPWGYSLYEFELLTTGLGAAESNCTDDVDNDEDGRVNDGCAARAQPVFTDDAYIYNNIFAHEGSVAWPVFTSAAAFYYNTFYGSASCVPYDPAKLTSWPQFVSSPPSSIDDFELQAGSPALETGVLEQYLGPRDLWGNPVSTSAPPNRGAYNGFP